MKSLLKRLVIFSLFISVMSFFLVDMMGCGVEVNVDHLTATTGGGTTGKTTGGNNEQEDTSTGGEGTTTTGSPGGDINVGDDGTSGGSATTGGDNTTGVVIPVDPTTGTTGGTTGGSTIIGTTTGTSTGGTTGGSTTGTTTGGTTTGTSTGGTTGGSTTGTTTGSNPPPLACTPNTTVSCYTGRAGTQGVGACQAGNKTCLADGSGYGPCSDVTPTFEYCGSGLDTNCDGVLPPASCPTCAGAVASTGSVPVSVGALPLTGSINGQLSDPNQTPIKTYYGGTGSGSLVCVTESLGPTSTVIPQNQPSNIPAGTIMFVTQVPNVGFSTISQPFSNHLPTVKSAPRGGDLYIRYGDDGALRNLTQEAGLGETVPNGNGVYQQRTNAIAVRDPSIHWSGTKALVSIVKGAPTSTFALDASTVHWQIYEVTGFGKGENVSFTKVPNQPTNEDNVYPIYGTDGRIIFYSSLMPFGVGGRLLDEYESAPSLTGMYSMNPSVNGGDIVLLDNQPSGGFDPIISSDGRIIFTRWDHLKRDQQAEQETKRKDTNPVTCPNEQTTANCLDVVQAPNPVTQLPDTHEIFPEHLVSINSNENSFDFNHFFLWEQNEDGTEHETTNHLGRHELGGSYTVGVFKDDPFLKDLAASFFPQFHANTETMPGVNGGFFRPMEDPTHPGRFYFVFTEEFQRAKAGDILMMDAPDGVNANDIQIVPMTDVRIFNPVFQLINGVQTALPVTGHYRDPLPMSDGSLIAAYTDEYRQEFQLLAQAFGNGVNAGAFYDFRLYPLVSSNGFMVADTQNPLIPQPITKSIDWFNGSGITQTYSGALWEIQPVEVRARDIPARRIAPASQPTDDVFTEEGVDKNELRDWLIQNNLALITSLNVTQRDKADFMQPFNLKVQDPVNPANFGATSIRTGNGGKVYPISYFQIVVGDALRAYRGPSSVGPIGTARRRIAQFLQDARILPWLSAQAPINPVSPPPPGSVPIATDGSIAAFVPAQKPLAWQTVDLNGKPVVRERNWITFASGEIRTCVSCHGVNKLSQTDTPKAQINNKPIALRALLQAWKAANP